MKRVLLWMMGLWVLSPVSAQIDFRDISFAEALAAAKAEHKMVFMDCYTSWCGPCKLLASNVFPQKKAGDYFNPRFVSIQVDMEKGEGIDLRKRYDVNAYPTLLVLDADGELLYRHAGYLEVDALIEFAEKGGEGDKLTEMRLRYESGDRSAVFIRDYLALLDEEAMSAAIRKVTDDFLKDKTDAVFSDSLVYEVFRAYAIPVSEVFQQVYARKSELAKRYGAESGQALELAWESYGQKFLKRQAKEVVGYDAAGLKAYGCLMQKCKVPEADAILAEYLIDGAMATEDWELLLNALCDYVSFSRLEEGHLNYACCILEWKQQDPEARQKLASLIRQRVDDLEGVEDTSGRTMTVGDETMPILEYYRRSYKELLQKLK